ncbi:hypothetical protein F4823DRAFT_566719 [Ustulina deusta]|nr:hypothetical protein F4823DRAFT_566719 [Ustulina deusta]
MADLPGPGSPWAMRHGIDSDIYFSLGKKDALIHSWLAPSRPWLDPRFYDAEPGEDEFVPPATYQELDEVLATEEFQRVALQGIPSWKVAPLNSVLSLWGESPAVLSGHRPEDAKIYFELVEAYRAQRIEVRSASWLPFFKKNHWFDLPLGDKPDTIEESDGKKWTISRWSVDDDRIWAHIKFTTEIANRILVALIRDNNTWLGTLLYGRIQRWYELYGNPENAAEHKEKGEDKKILQTPSIERSECARMNRPFLGQDIEPDAEKRKEFICRMLKFHAWGFIPSSQSSRGDSSPLPKLGITFARISVNILKLLCGGTISIAERCILYVRLAMTMIHELMHCIHVMRVCVYHDNVSPELRQDAIGEPFVNGEPIAELGRSFEAAVFGGTPWDAPSLCAKYSKKLIMVELGFQYPSKLGGSRGMGVDKNHPAMKFHAPIPGWYLPAALFWRIQSKGFWDTTPPDGRNGFLLPRLFCTERQMDEAAPKLRFKDISISSYAGEDNPFQDMMRRWNERVALWSARRPWYELAAREWEKTPWSNILVRMEAEKFITAYKERNEAACADAAQSLEASIIPVNHLTWPTNIVSGLPPNNSIDGEPSTWLFHCLGMLMLAALPQRLSDQDRIQRLESTIYEPSRTAQMSGYRNVTIGSPGDPSPALLKRDGYFNRFGDTGWTPANSRMEFVNQAMRMISYVMERRKVHASSPFITAIIHLLEYTRYTLADPAFDQSSWLPDFPFQIPEYDPTSYRHWDSATRSWMIDYHTPTQLPGLPMTEL